MSNRRPLAHASDANLARRIKRAENSLARWTNRQGAAAKDKAYQLAMIKWPDRLEGWAASPRWGVVAVVKSAGIRHWKVTLSHPRPVACGVLFETIEDAQAAAEHLYEKALAEQVAEALEEDGNGAIHYVPSGSVRTTCGLLHTPLVNVTHLRNRVTCRRCESADTLR